MTTTRVFTDPRSQHFKSDGVSVNSSGKIYFREPGAGSTTLKSVYADKGLTTPFVNPVVLDSNGRAPAIFMNGDYNVQLTDSADAQIWRVDNYQPPTVDGQFDAWDSTLTYAVNDYVRYINGLYYISLQSGNTGNVPGTSPLYWSQAFFLTVYNSSTTYAANDVVYYDGNIYTSLVGSNTGNTPDTGFTYWKLPGVSVPPVTGYTGGIVTYDRTSLGGVLDALTTLTTPLTYESIGPTGSGATHVWTEMDELPSNTTSVKLLIQGNSERTAGASALFSTSLSLRTTGGVNAVPVYDVRGYGSSTEPGAAAGRVVIEFPVDASLRFDASYNDGSTDDSDIFIRLLGFSVSST